MTARLVQVPASAARTTTSLAAAAVLITALAACGGSKSNGSSSGGSSEIAIGLLASLSGNYATLGPATVAGAQVAVDDLNAGGGITVHGHKYKVVLKVLNDQSNPQVALSQEQALVRDDKVIAVVGPLADAAVTVAPVAAQQKVINITASTGAKALLQTPGGLSKYPLLFSTTVSVAYQAAAVIAGIQHWYPNARRVAVVSSDNAAMKTIYPYLQKDSQAAGMTFSGSLFPEGTTDLSAISSKVVDFNPDIVVSSPDDPTVVNVIHQLDGAGLGTSIPIFNIGGDETVAPSAQGHPVVTQNLQEADLLDTSNTAVSDFVAAVKAKAKGSQAVLQALNYADLYYPVIIALGKAIVAAGTTSDTSAIAKAMTTLSPISVLGGQVRWVSDHTFPYPIVSVLTTTRPAARKSALIQASQ